MSRPILPAPNQTSTAPAFAPPAYVPPGQSEHFEWKNGVAHLVGGKPTRRRCTWLVRARRPEDIGPGAGECERPAVGVIVEAGGPTQTWSVDAATGENTLVRSYPGSAKHVCAKHLKEAEKQARS